MVKRRFPSKTAPPVGSPASQLSGFMAKYDPAIAAEGRSALATLRRILPGGGELVYDNYNWLVVGFGPTERPSEAVLSLVFTPRWLTLCFLLHGAQLSDPERLLRGSGSRVRNIRLASAKDLNRPAVRALIGEALSRGWPGFDQRRPRRLIIKSISAKQRPRRPSR